MKRFTAVALVFLLFVTGILVGVVGTHAFYAHHLREPDQLVDLGSRWHMQRLRRELQLTPEQERQMRELVKTTQEEIRGLRDDFMPKVRDRIGRAHEEFVQSLDPEQRRRFEEIMRRHGRRYLRAFGFPPELEHGRHSGPGWRRGRHGTRDRPAPAPPPAEDADRVDGGSDPGA